MYPDRDSVIVGIDAFGKVVIGIKTPLLALADLLNATQKIKSLRVKVKSLKEVSHLNQVWLVILQSKYVILQGTLVGHLKSVMLKDLTKLLFDINVSKFLL